MGSRAVQYRPPQYDVDASQQTYLVQKLRPVQDPRTMPKVIGGPDWSPAASRVGKVFRVAAPNGATVRAGPALDSREVAVLARDALVEVVDATPDERRVRVEAVRARAGSRRSASCPSARRTWRRGAKWPLSRSRTRTGCAPSSASTAPRPSATRARSRRALLPRRRGRDPPRE